MIIGLTGTNASGKGTAAAYLKKKGFRYYSLSDELRYVLRKSGTKPTRENLIRAGKKYREREGRGCLAKIVLEKMGGRKRAVVDSVRNLGEVRELRKKKSFVLIAFDAPAKLRFERARKRMSSRDPKTLKEFRAREREELSGKGAEQQLRAVMRKADLRITNRGSRSELFRSIDAILKAESRKHSD